ncbi:MAG: hypothetical protein JKY43_10425 [Phycisphaerales bacterium]|nr:hypothetical protein [Phycisphaerales bacterium]
MNDFNQNIYSQNDTTYAALPAGRTSHSGLGVSSFITACLGTISMFGFIVTAAIIESSSPNGMDAESTQAVILGLGMIGTALAMLLSGGLGLASLFQSTKKRIFGILGLCISGGVIMLFLLLLVVGLMIG